MQSLAALILLLSARALWAGEAALPLTPELLRRWGYDVEKVLALAPERRLEVQEAVTALERGRAARLALLRRVKGPQWIHFVDAAGLLTPEGDSAVDAYSAQSSSMAVPARLSEFARKDGKPLTGEDFARAQVLLDKLFDGVADRKNAAALGGEVVVDARVRNETLHSLTLSNPKTGFSVEVGQLYVDGRHPVADSSWYGNLRYGADSDADSWVDYRFRAQIGWVDLKSRFFADDAPDPRVDRLFELGKDLGVSGEMLDRAAKYTDYDDSYKAHGIIVSSLLLELGRAYHLFGPIDATWNMGALIKTAWVAPNAAFDETAGLRIKLDDGLYLGLFGGVQQNVSPLGDELVQQAFARSRIKGDWYVESSPHASVGLWGRLPGTSDAAFSLTATQRRNDATTVRQAEASLMTTFLNHPIALRGGLSDETGDGIEFGRRKTRAQIDYQLSDRAQLFLAYERERIVYGNAKLDASSFLAGFEINGGGADASTLTMDHMFGGEYQSVSPALRPAFKETLAKINANIAAGLGVVDQAQGVYEQIRSGSVPGELEPRLNQLSRALSRLDGPTAGHLLEELNGVRMSDAQKVFLSNVWLKTVSEKHPYHDELRKKLASCLGGSQNFLNEAYWLETRALGLFQDGLGGRLLSAEQKARFDAYMDETRGFVQAHPTLSPDDLDALGRRGLAALEEISGRPLSPAQRERFLRELADGTRDLGALLARFSGGGEISQNAERVLSRIDDASAFWSAHRREIGELLGMLANKGVWESVIIRAGRASLMAAMERHGKLDVPVLGHEITLQLDASAAVAAAGILASRGGSYGLRPLTHGQSEQFLRGMAARSLGLDFKDATDEAIIGKLFGLAGDKIRAQLDSRLGGLLDALGQTTPAELAEKIFSAVGPAAAEQLQRRYGAELEALLPPGATPEQLRALLTERLPAELTAYLQEKYGKEIAAGLEKGLSWAAEVLRREVNMTLIQLVLASEELNRLTVDHGQKISDLDLQFAMRSFEKLDERGRLEARGALRDVSAQLARDAGAAEARLLDRIKDENKAALEALQLDPRWPAGLRVLVPEKSIAPLMSYYGAENIFGFIESFKARYAAHPRSGGAVILLEFEEADSGAAAISRNRDGADLKFVLGRPRDARGARFKLEVLESCLDELWPGPSTKL